MPSQTRRRLWLAAAATAVVVLPLGWFWQASLLPDTYDLAAMGYPDYGGGPRPAAGDHTGHDGHPGTPVAELTADPDRRADESFTLRVHDDGDGYTVNGTSPGPVLDVTQGDLVEVTLVNENIEDGTTLHWHGVDVPNAADGVAGVTQDAVGPGEQLAYRFVADQVGTFWYHSHQVSHEQVRQGLFGALVIHPAEPDAEVLERVAVLHEYDDGPTLNGRAGVETVDAEAGQRVRLRVVNTDNGLSKVWVTGAAYEVLAVDGTDLNQPGPVEGDAVGVPAGGRVDLGLVVPEGGVRVDFGGTTSMVFGADPTGGGQTIAPDDFVDLLSYGEPADLGFDPAQADRTFDYRIGKRPGFLDGRPGMWWTVNGHLFPDLPMFMVSEGDVVVFRIENNSDDAHPMHLHGHHAVVLSRDGEPATGSPWWVDSLEVRTGESYEIAFLADNPGIWMDHCHNLPHAAQGLVAHLMYDGVSSSYRIGGTPGNEPE
ncbi:MAG TPA: multicopper oxidase family protein [Nocardioides sp.]|nr:multicopper oxidase family protein [Nocardioides sp.]